MPLFEYSCRKCGKKFEALVMGSRKPACPACSSHDLEKLHSSFGARSGGGRSGHAAPSRFT